MKATRRIKIATAQYPLDPVASIDGWASKVADWVATGARTGADLLVFPEYGSIEVAAAGGPLVTNDLGATLEAVASAASATGEIWKSLSAEHGVHILAPSGPERRGADFVNAARLYAPNGQVGVQEKLILTPFERGWGIKAGSGQHVFDTTIGRFGIAICYDSEFPLLVRALAEAGAEVVLVPSCTEHASGYHRVRTAAMARALESQIATVISATVGLAPWSVAVDRNCGAGGIFVPADVAMSMTGVIVEGVLDASGWVSGEIDLAQLARVRTSGEMRNWSDWSKQRGALSLQDGVTVVVLDRLGPSINTIAVDGQFT